MNLDVNNLLFERLTHIVYGDSNIGSVDGVVEKDPDDTCSICSRKASDQPKAFGTYMYQGVNSYKVPVQYCMCCNALFHNNPEIMGIEKSTAPQTANKWGMLAGTGMVTECRSGRTLLFMPPKSAEKIPETTKAQLAEKKIEFFECTQFEQLRVIASQGIEFPALWVNSFGRKTDQLVANLRLSGDVTRVIMVNDDELNSSIAARYKINLRNLIAIADVLNGNKLKAKFKRTMSEYSSGASSPADVMKFLQENPELQEVFSLLPLDPHLRVETLKLADKV
ncbi:hypothetical protein AB4254_12120 [Vibrio breoganii]